MHLVSINIRSGISTSSVVVLAASAEVQVVRHLVVVVVVHGDVGLCRLQDENCDGARRRLLCW